MPGRPLRGTGRVARCARSPAAETGGNPERRAYHRALVRLGRRDQSSTELRRSLAREGLEPDDIERALQRLVERRLLDDVAFAERYSRRSLSRGIGRKRIGARLATRGVSRQDALRGLGQALELVPEEPALKELARRYWTRHERIEPARRAQRLFAFLLRRGFPVAAVLLCMRGLSPAHAEDIEGLAPEEQP